MQIVIPMSGVGARFAQAGYRELKPLIEVDGLPMIEHVVRMFPGERDFLFICTTEAVENTRLTSVLQRVAPSGRICVIAPHKLGPVHAVLQARQQIRASEEVIVNYCDFSVVWDYQQFKSEVQQRNCAGALTAYRGFHPHSLGPNLYAYMRERRNYLLEIREKHCFTEQKMNEYASTGTYYFRSGELLLKYFDRAVERGLQTNGEFYASSPYNLLVEDGLEVYIHEVAKFLQWGTPEDLQEYVSWSTYFRQEEHWKPSLPASSGTNLVPMAGAGVRFAREGYADIKPLVPAGGRPIVERALDSLPTARQWVGICQKQHLYDSRLVSSVSREGRNIKLLAVDGLTEGQASTCMQACEHIPADEPLLIAPCDSAVIFDERRYAELLENQAIDCLVWTFCNHPHANRNPQQYGWVVSGEDGSVTKILCKQPPPGKIADAHGIIGTFWFRKARYFFEAAAQLIAQNRRVSQEFYADMAIQVLLEQGRTAVSFPVRHYVSLGTPDDVRTYDYWAAHFRATKHQELAAL